MITHVAVLIALLVLCIGVVYAIKIAKAVIRHKHSGYSKLAVTDMVATTLGLLIFGPVVLLISTLRGDPDIVVLGGTVVIAVIAVIGVAIDHMAYTKSRYWSLG